MVIRVKNDKNPTVSINLTLLTRNLADNFPYFHTAGQSSTRCAKSAQLCTGVVQR